MTLGVVRPLVKMGVVSGGGLPILMYHSISDSAESDVSPYYRTTTSPAVFEQHLSWLNAAGFRSVGPDEAMRLVQQKAPRSDRAVFITFDDGFRDFHQSAFPALQRQGHTATMYLPTGFIGEKRRSFKGRECLTWGEVRELRSKGMFFGAHTVSHPVLYQLSWPDIENELAVAKVQIEHALGEEITSAAYPYAYPQEDDRFTKTLTSVLSRCGYRNCVTTVVGQAHQGDDLFRLKRLPVNSCDDEALFMAKLDGAYDWLSVLQSSFRQAKRWSKRTPLRND